MNKKRKKKRIKPECVRSINQVFGTETKKIHVVQIDLFLIVQRVWFFIILYWSNHR